VLESREGPVSRGGRDLDVTWTAPTMDLGEMLGSRREGEAEEMRRGTGDTSCLGMLWRYATMGRVLGYEQAIFERQRPVGCGRGKGHGMRKGIEVKRWYVDSASRALEIRVHTRPRCSLGILLHLFQK